MKEQYNKSKRGFTIIEVVLVLAIAGLIFLMVFLALPALQRSQRDTQRRSAYSEFLTQVSNYQSNNRGRLPATTVSAWEDFISAYLRPTENCVIDEESTSGDEDAVPTYTGSDCVNELPSTFLDPVGQPYYIKEVYDFSDPTVDEETGKKVLNWKDNQYQIYVYNKATCEGENAIVSDGNRNIAIRVKLEGGGTYCGNN